MKFKQAENACDITYSEWKHKLSNNVTGPQLDALIRKG